MHGSYTGRCGQCGRCVIYTDRSKTHRPSVQCMSHKRPKRPYPYRPKLCHPSGLSSKRHPTDFTKHIDLLWQLPVTADQNHKIVGASDTVRILSHHSPLFTLYKKSLDDGSVPLDWKTGHVTPVHKKGSRAQVGNYRPVSLTSVVCKVMEKLVTVSYTHLTLPTIYSV